MVTPTHSEKRFSVPEIIHEIEQKTNRKVNPLIEYTMDKTPRGKCLIINNKNFQKMEARSGSDIDTKNLEETFRWLKFDVEIVHDCTSDVIEEQVEHLSEMNHKKYDCFVLCVLSHGSEKGIAGTDEEYISMEYIRQSFVGNYCPSLHGKPKVFFIQACRGSETDQGRPYRPAPPVSSDDATKQAPKLLPVESDLVFAYSTTPGMHEFLFIIL